MASFGLAVVAAVLYFLAAIGVGFGAVDIVVLGHMFVALAIAVWNLPIRSRV